MQLLGLVEGLRVAVVPGAAPVAVFQSDLHLGSDDDKRPVLFNSSGVECLAAPAAAASAASGAVGASASLLHAALKVAQQNRGVEVYGQVTALDGDTATVRLAVVLPNAAWHPRSRWRGGDAAAQLFAHLAPPALAPEPPPVEAREVREAEPASYLQRLRGELRGLKPLEPGADPYSLVSSLRALPVKTSEVDPPPMLAADPGRPCHLAQLPTALLVKPPRGVLCQLDKASLEAAAASCRHLRELTRDVAPGLRLRLYPHQRAAVMWMQARERAGGTVPHPTIAGLPCAEVDGAAACFAGAPLPRGLPCWGDTAAGKLLTEAPPALPDFQGGLFCDEPGLGKTITALALLLRTLGTLPAAPPGAEVTWAQPGRGFYLLPREGAGTVAQVLASQGSRRSLRRARSCSTPGSGGGAGELEGGSPPAEEACDDPELIMRRNKKQRRSATPQAPQAPHPAQLRGAGSSVAPAAGMAQQQQQQQQPPPQQPLAGTADGGAAAQAQAAAAAAPGAATQAAEGAGRDSPALDIWVQCDLCEKWRCLPAGCQAPPADSQWVCAMNPDEALQWQGCGAPEAAATGLVLSSPGWLPAGKAPGLEHNVAFYRRLLERHPDLCTRHSPLAWLARQSPAALAERPFTVPAELRRWFIGFGHAFRRMQLEAVHAQQQQQSSRSTSRGGRGGRGGRGCRGGRGGRGGRRRPRASSDESSADSGSVDDEDSGAGSDDADSLPDPEGGGESDSDEDGAPRVAAAAGAAQQRRRQQRRRGRQGAGVGAASWQRPATHAGLQLDLAALQQALAQGPSFSAHRIYMSAATLVVVPKATLIPHWRDQIVRHVRRPDGSGLRVLVYTVRDRDTARLRGAPITPQMLAWEPDVVITTFDTMSAEWTRSGGGALGPIDCSPLMQVHWLRVILDEGHAIGSSAMTNKLQMGIALRAERRWVMTGTPTPNTLDASVDRLQPLLAFLHHQPFGSVPESWKKAVQFPFTDRREAGRLRLLALLQRCLIRASKAELISNGARGIPPMHYKVTLLPFAPTHATSYNGFVEIIRFNLFGTDICDPDHRESLLGARAQLQKHARKTARNLLLSCNVAGNCALQVLESDVEETLLLLTERHLSGSPDGRAALAARAAAPGSSGGPSQGALLKELVAAAGPDWVRRAKHIRACLEEGGACEVCAAVVRVLFVTPCAHLQCVDCTFKSVAEIPPACATCGERYRMQPVDDPARKKENPNPKWPVPDELIEWQSAYAQKGAQGVQEGFWQADWKHTQSTKCLYLLKRLRQVGAAVPAGGAPQKPRVKAIVYTQFWEHHHLIEHYLNRHGVRLAVLRQSDPADKKNAELGRFTNEWGPGVLLMDSAGMVGLDLSFASHVFLMEPIPDKSVWEQVVGRAHRMGARSDVYVEVLAMQGTVEEHLLQRMHAAGTAGASAGAPAAAPDAAAVAPEAPAGVAAAAAPAGRRQAASRAAAQLSARNAMLLSLRPVPVKCLEEFRDEPGGEEGGGCGGGGGAEDAAERRVARAVVAAAEAAEAAADSGSGGSGSGEDEEEEEPSQSQAAVASASQLTSSAQQLTWPEVAAGAPRRQMAASPRGPAAAAVAPRQPGRRRAVRFAGIAEEDSVPEEAGPAGRAASGGDAAGAAAAAAAGITAALFIKPELAEPEISTAAHAPAAPAVPAGGGAAAAAAAAPPAAAAVVAGACCASDLQGTPASKRRRTVSFGPSPSGSSAGAGGAAAAVAAAAAPATGQEESGAAAPAAPAAAAAAAAPPGGPKPNRFWGLLLQRTGARQASPVAAQPAAQPQEQAGELGSGAATARAAASPEAAAPAQLPAAAAAAPPHGASGQAAVPPNAAAPVLPAAVAAVPPAPAVAAQSPAAAAAAAGSGDVRVLLLEHCKKGAAQAAGLDQSLVGKFCAAFTCMEAHRQADAAAMLPLMLHGAQPCWGAAAAYVEGLLRGMP